MRLLVTGGSGFLGGYVLEEAARRGHEVVALARSETAAAAVAKRGAEPLTGDLDDPGGLPDVFSSAQCTSLLNIASLGFGHAPAIVAAARAAGIDRAVFVSTTAVTTRLAARSKRVRLDAERQIRESGLKWTIVRPTMIYGAPGDRNLSRLLAVLARVPVLPVPGGGRHLQQPVHVADVAGAVLSAVSGTGHGRCHLRPGRAGAAPRSPNCCGSRRAQSAAARVSSRCRWPPWSPPRAATNGCLPIRGSGRSRSSGWLKTRPLPSATRPVTWATRPGRSPRASSSKPAPWDWPGRGLRSEDGEFALLARTAAHLQPRQVTQRARLRAQRAALRGFPPVRHWLLAGPEPGLSGRLASPVQPARRAPVAELAGVPGRCARGASSCSG